MISIVLCTYNGERYLQQQLESLLVQSVMPDEIIICDDNSTDCTFQILEDFAKRYNFVTLYRHAVNVGFLRNFEFALSKCSGLYVFLADQDDIWLPSHIQSLIHPLKNGAVLACGNAELMGSNGEDLNLNFQDVINASNADLCLAELLITNRCQGACMAIHQDVLSMALPIPAQLDYHDHWIACVAAHIGEICYIDEVLLRYRLHDRAISTQDLLRNGSKRISVIKNLINIAALYPKSHNPTIRTYVRLERYLRLRSLCAVLAFYFNHRDVRRVFSNKSLPSLRTLKFLLMILKN